MGQAKEGPMTDRAAMCLETVIKEGTALGSQQFTPVLTIASV
jgi:hypothetical protein